MYSITGGNSIINGTPSFSINDTTGWISVNVSSLDREEQAMYTLEITVSLLSYMVLCSRAISSVYSYSMAAVVIVKGRSECIKRDATHGGECFPLPMASGCILAIMLY